MNAPKMVGEEQEGVGSPYKCVRVSPIHELGVSRAQQRPSSIAPGVLNITRRYDQTRLLGR
jgi:hypothetical protein